MSRGPRRAIAIAGVVLAAVLAPQAAFAATAPATGGGDVSYYQGTTTLPDSTQLDFAVVGVNAGRPTDPNPSLADQLAWAAQSKGVGHAKVDVYVASANPGTAGTWWPSSDRTKAGTKVRSPYGSCTARKATTACAWVYGNSYGRDDVQAVPAGTAIGTWWIDVEQDNTWSSSTARNRAVVEGMVAGLRAEKQRVGIYGLSTQLRDILGTVPASSPITKLQAWVAGAEDEASALQCCSGASPTAGRVVLVQWVDFANTVDHDVACGVLTQPKPTISGTYRSGHRLTAKVRTWSPSGVHLTYRWTRDGHPIAKATHRTYTLKKADRHHRIGVTVTGVLTGYSKAVQRSATHRIPR